jgi:hypothetical protein
MSAKEKMFSFVQLEVGSGSALVVALCACRQRGGQGPTFCRLGHRERWLKKGSVLPC